MGGEQPKQFIPVEGRPVLMRTLDAFHACDASIQLILVLPHDHQAYWHELCAQYQFAVPHRIADGGATRFHSVQNGLALVDAPDALVAVHDGVRPFASKELILRAVDCATKNGSAIPVVKAVDSYRAVEGEESHIIDRAPLRLVQTPQIFAAPTLRAAYDTDFRNEFTDDASVVEQTTPCRVTLCQGERSNIKITTPEDMVIARAIAESLKE